MSALQELYTLDADALRKRLLDSVGTGTWPPVHTAVEWVIEKHQGQTRLDGTDFACHPLRVALILHELGGQSGADVLCAGLLHDVVEDTETTLDQVSETFGGKVGDLVRAMTLLEPTEGKTKYDRNLAHFESLRWDGRDAQIVRSADRLDNVRTIVDVPLYDRREEFIRETEEGLVPLALATNTAIYHALVEALEKAKA
jgi:GTP diphosphokinase / guanosine-3',5'-bis(diphosphate) 3'-diphosphatase